MQTEKFLSLVLAKTGHPCIVTPAPKGGKGFWHYPSKSIAQAAKIAIREHDSGKDVFFAVGTLKEREVLKQLGDGTTKKTYRTADNISHWRCWIADLDIGDSTPAKPKYSSQDDAVKDIDKFCRDTGLPMPMLVSSGYGIHAYWVCDADIPAEAWQKVAVRFKALLAACGVLADTSRTSDVASVLRVVGTSNLKRGIPKPVEVRREQANLITPGGFLRLVVAASKTFNVAPPLVRVDSDYNTGLGNFSTPSEPSQLLPIIKQCAQVKQFVVNKGDIPEPEWYKAIQLVKFCQHKDHAGDELVHKLSAGSPQYSEEETADKLTQLASYGPTLCSSFEDVNPEGCAGCKHHGRIKSPIVLGKDTAEASAPVMQVVHRDGSTVEVELPNPPTPYIRTSDGKIGRRLRDPETRQEYTDIFYEYDIHPTKRMLDESTMTEIFYFRSWLPKDGWREYMIPASMVYDPKSLFMTMAERGVMPQTKNQGLIVQYMLAYMQHLQTLASAESIYSQMGWKKDGSEFVMGDVCYHKDGSDVKIKLLEQYAPLVSNFESKGTLEEWKKITNIYSGEGYEEFALAFMVGFGSPMFQHSGFEGGIFSLNGPSGAGKSTILRVIHSIFGKPLHNVLLKKDTENSKYVILGAYNNLPVTLDEITSISPEESSQLAFSITDGRDKRRLSSDASLKAGVRSWRLPMFTTTNRSLSQMILSFKPESSGEMMRILERRVRPLHAMTFAEARKMFEPLEHNYGVAGPILISWYVQNLDEAKRLYGYYIDKLSDEVGGLVPERFWLAMCALSLLGCHVGKLLNLHDYSEEKLFLHCCRVVLESRTETTDSKKSSVDVLTDFLNGSIGETLVVYVGPRDKNVEIRVKPRLSTLSVRTELDSNRMYIDKNAIRNYCSTRGHDFGAVEGKLIKKKVVLRRDSLKQLGEGTFYAGGMTKTWLVDTASPLLCGVVPSIVKGMNNATRIEEENEQLG